MSKYWKKRFEQENINRMSKSEVDMMNKIKSSYKKALNDIESAIKLTSDYRDLTRLNSMKAYIEERINLLGAEEFYIVKNGLTSHVDSFSLTMPNAAEEIINRVWCADGKVWSDRIWIDKVKLKNTLVDGLTKIVLEGASGADLTKALQDQSKFYSTMVNPTFKDIADQGFNQSFNNASRLVRTELTYVTGQCSLQRYKEMGCDEYEYVAEKDERVCEICSELDGKVFKIENAQVGINLMPLHPGCRCTIVPTVKI